MSWYFDQPPLNAAEKRAKAAREAEALRAKGQQLSPVVVEGRQIAHTFWGRAWCDHIEQLSDFESRLSKGKTYTRNGSIIHLAITPGRVEAIVSGSSTYEVSIEIDALPADQWTDIKARCAGRVGSLVELLQGKLSAEVMRVITDPETGMFPHADDFRLDCNCPDFARLCKHLAGCLYGVGARLDTAPELLFTLRGVDVSELLQQAGNATGMLDHGDADGGRTLQDEHLADIFGIDLALEAPAVEPIALPAPKKRGRRTGK